MSKTDKSCWNTKGMYFNKARNDIWIAQDVEIILCWNLKVMIFHVNAFLTQISGLFHKDLTYSALI